MLLIDSEKFVGSKMEIKVDGKSVKTYRSSLEINENNASTILDKMANTLKDDSKFIKILSKSGNYSENKAKEALTSMFDNMKDETKNMKTLTVNIYTEGVKQNFVKLELVEDKDVISLTKNSEDTYAYLIDMKSEKEKVSGTVTYKLDKNNITLATTFKAVQDGSDVMDGTINMKINETKTDKIEKIDVTNSVKAEELTTADQNYMTLKMLSNPAFIKLLSTLS